MVNQRQGRAPRGGVQAPTVPKKNLLYCDMLQPLVLGGVNQFNHGKSVRWSRMILSHTVPVCH